MDESCIFVRSNLSLSGPNLGVLCTCTPDRPPLFVWSLAGEVGRAVLSRTRACESTGNKVENLNVPIAMMAQFRLVSARIQRISGDGTEHRRKEGLSKVRFAPPSPLVHNSQLKRFHDTSGKVWQVALLKNEEKTKCRKQVS